LVFKNILPYIFLAIVAMADFSFGAGRLAYFEVQAIGGYSAVDQKVLFYSMSPMDVMQKPGLGFDILQRFSGSASDWGLLAIQTHLAYDQEGENKIEPQLYNAYLKIKAGFADIWLGHDRPAFGLSSYFDNHSLLLQTLSMNGFAYDRDWGLGLNRDLSWGDAAISLTSGSGMPLYFKGNYQFSARASRGVLSQDNYNAGFSASYGKPIETMGYHLMDDRPSEKYYFGADATWLWNNFENRFEGIAERSAGQNIYGVFWRNTINLAAENRLKLEFQPTYLNYLTSDDLQLAAGLSYQITGDLTMRSMYNYDRFSDDHRVVLQLYWYHKIL